MTRTRAALFDEDEVDLSAFKAEVKPQIGFPSKSDVKTISEQSGFSSREPHDITNQIPTSGVTAHDTNTSRRKPYNSSDTQKVQLNIRVSQEVADIFYRLTKENEWSLGQTLKKAVLALENQLSKG